MVDDYPAMHERLFAQAGLSLERLRTFREIATAGGITAAAHNDPNRQSQFSRQLKELEKFFGVELIRRGRGPLRLTPAGTELHAVAGVALRGLEEFLASCGSQPLELSVGAGESLIQWWLLPRIPAPSILGKNVTLAFENLRNEDILSGLKTGVLDFGVLSRSVDDPKIESVPLGRMEFRLFVPETLCDQSKKPKASILDGLPLAQLTSASAITRTLEQEAKRKKLNLNIRFRFSSYPQLARAILNGQVAGVMPALAAAGMPAGTVRTVALPLLDNLTREVQLAWSVPMSEVRPAIPRVAKLLASAWRSQEGEPAKHQNSQASFNAHPSSE
jgi:DNA-binding transcriptional LysR family regulator